MLRLPGRAASAKPVKNHDTIYHYAKNYKLRKQNRVYIPYSEKYLKEWFKYKEAGGRVYQKRMRGRDERGNVVWEKQYLDESKGIPLATTWTDILQVYADPRGYKDNTTSEITDYPTQKPEAIAERIIKLSSDKGDIVADFFVGSGTTIITAQKLGRRWIACDINLGAIQTTAKRLNQIIQEQKKEQSKLLKDFKGLFAFKIYNVNDYDVFKNELEAKEIIMEMYGVEPIKQSYFDGVLDNNFAKVMPMNRVLNKMDIRAVLKNVEDKIDAFSVKKKSKSGDAMYEEGVLIIASGMELDVLDFLKKENKTGVKIEVRDILTDKKNLIFKQKPEAKIETNIKDKKLLVKIREFYSPILMRKMEIENGKVLKKEYWAKVENFHQIIDSVAIDIDYNGKLFNAEIMDLPTKRETVKAEYGWDYPKRGNYTVAVKIIDVLGEEYFETFELKA